MAVDPKTIDLRLALTDNPVGAMPEFTRCTQHADDTGSLAAYPDHLHCFGCGFHLATFTGLAYLLYGTWDRDSMRRAVSVSEKYTLKALDAYRERVNENVKTDPLPRGLAIAYHNLLTTTRRHRQEWYEARGLNWLTIDLFLLGHDGTRFTIPIFSDTGKLLTFRYRRDDFYGTTYFDSRRGEERPLAKYSGLTGRNGLYLYPEYDIASMKPETLVVVEGELDAVRLWQEGIPAVSTTNGAGNVFRIPTMIREKFPFVSTLLLATDIDAPGNEAAYEAGEVARALDFTVSNIGWDPEWGKDVTELFLNGHGTQVFEGVMRTR